MFFWFLLRAKRNPTQLVIWFLEFIELVPKRVLGYCNLILTFLTSQSLAWGSLNHCSFFHGWNLSFYWFKVATWMVLSEIIDVWCKELGGIEASILTIKIWCFFSCRLWMPNCVHVVPSWCVSHVLRSVVPCCRGVCRAFWMGLCFYQECVVYGSVFDFVRIVITEMVTMKLTLCSYSTKFL